VFASLTRYRNIACDNLGEARKKDKAIIQLTDPFKVTAIDVIRPTNPFEVTAVVIQPKNPFEVTAVDVIRPTNPFEVTAVVIQPKLRSRSLLLSFSLQTR
jgi:hypothetical protein